MALPPLTLTIQSGPNAGQAFQFTGQPKIIGRGTGSDIVIPDESLSRQHAKLQAMPNGYVIEDLQSTNGTFVNQQRITGSAPLRPSDTLRLGSAVTIKVELAAGAVGDNEQTLIAGAAALNDAPTAALTTPPSAALDNAPTVSAPALDNAPTIMPDRTVVPKQPVSPAVSVGQAVPVAPPPQKSRSAWVWVMGAVILALIIVAGTMAYLQFSASPPPPPPPTEVAVQQPAETPTTTPSPIPTNTPEPDATSTPEPIAVPGVAASAAEIKFPPPNAVIVDAFCGAEVEVDAADAVHLDWGHPLAPADSETDYRSEWLQAAHYDVTLNGRPIDGFNFYQDGDNVLHFWHNLGLLEPGSHFVRVQWYASRPISNGMDVAPADGQVDEFGPGPAGEGSCEIIVAEPLAEATVTPTPTTTPTKTPSVTPTPTKKAPVALPPAPLGVFQDFESQSAWKRGDQPYGEFTRSGSQVHSGSYAGQLSYNFPTPDNDYVVFLQNRPLAGRPNAISAWVYGDGSGHFLNVWFKDANGQSWGMTMGTVDHTGWQEMIAFLDPGQPWPSGHISGPDNGAIDYPITFQALVLDDGSDTYSGRGAIYIDDLNSQEGYSPPPSTPTPAPLGQVGAPGGGNQPGVGPAVSGGYVLQVGGQHKYTEPWGAPWNGDPCKAHRDDSWNDKVRMRAFHLQLLLNNNTNVTVPGPWIPTYITANGKSDGFCYFGHISTSVPPGGVSDITFFTVVDVGDYVKEVHLVANGQPLQLCLGPDGSGGACGGSQQTGGQPVVVQPAPAQPAPAPSGGPYVLAIGNQHKYEEPWGAPVGGNSCRAWENNEWDDENPNFRGFNVEILFTNNSTAKVQDEWGENMTFLTAGGQEVTACYYGYNGAGPPPGGATSLTFFSVVPRGDYVQTMQLNLNGQFTQLCLDGQGGWSRC